jgi:hypothetical protein
MVLVVDNKTTFVVSISEIKEGCSFYILQQTHEISLNTFDKF